MMASLGLCARACWSEAPPLVIAPTTSSTPPPPPAAWSRRHCFGVKRGDMASPPAWFRADSPIRTRPNLVGRDAHDSLRPCMWDGSGGGMRRGRGREEAT